MSSKMLQTQALQNVYYETPPTTIFSNKLWELLKWTTLVKFGPKNISSLIDLINWLSNYQELNSFIIIPQLNFDLKYVCS